MASPEEDYVVMRKVMHILVSLLPSFLRMGSSPKSGSISEIVSLSALNCQPFHNLQAHQPTHVNMFPIKRPVLPPSPLVLGSDVPSTHEGAVWLDWIKGKPQ